jgi:hypothetical protein
MRKLVLTRFNDDKTRTHGCLLVFDGTRDLAHLWTLELPWRNNERMVSRIPAGRYRVTPERSAKLGWVLRLHDVPGRSDVLVHSGSFPAHTHGCILAGQSLIDIDKDNLADVSRSRAAMTELANLITDDALLVIVDAL